jgi:hypothetical protein
MPGLLFAASIAILPATLPKTGIPHSFRALAEKRPVQL